MKMNNGSKCKWNKKLYLIGILSMLFLTTFVSALELNPFATIKTAERVITEETGDYLKSDFNSRYGTIRLSKTFFWFETDKIAEYSLTKNTEVCFINCEAEGKVTLYQDGVLFDDVKFKTLTGRDTTITSSEYLIFDGYKDNYVSTPIYKEVCVDNLKNNSKTCSQIISGYIEENKPIEVWNKYNSEVLKAGNYRWKIKGKKEAAQSVDFIPIINKKEFSEWAVWNSSFSSGLLGYWGLNENAGTDTKEEVNGFYNGSLIGGTGWVTGINGSAVNGFASGKYINVTNSIESPFNLPYNKPFSVSFWINGSFSGERIAIGKSLEGYTGGWAIETNNQLIDVFLSPTWNTDTYKIRSGAVLVAGEWNFVTITYDGTPNTGLKAYHNGIELSVTHSPTSLSSGITNTLPVQFGSEGSYPLTNGVLDEIGIWNRSLSDSEVLDLYNGGTGIFYVPIPPDTSPTTTLNSPIDYYNSTLNLVALNCSAVDNRMINNISLWINGLRNYTITNGVTNFSEIYFNRNVGDGVYNWTCSADDNATITQTGWATNRTLTIDTLSPYFTLNSLSNVTTLSLPTNATLDVTTTDTHLETCKYSTSDNVTNTTYACNTVQNVSFATGGAKTILVSANDTFGHSNQTTYNVYVYYIQPTAIVTNPIIEGNKVNYTLYVNMTGISDFNVGASFIFNGTSQNFTRINSTNYVRFNSELIIPNIPGQLNTNVSWLWFYNLTGTSNLNITDNQNYSQFIFANCNSTITKKVLNITFKDETTGLQMNATMDLSTWNYYYQFASKSFIFINTSHNYEYDFCVYPETIASFNVSETLQYSHSESATYPQRKTIFNETYYNSSLTNKILYLLNYNNGITSNYQVVSVGNQVIANAHIIVQRTIAGSITTVADGLTDSSGTISFFLNPNYPHTYTVSAAGFSTQIQTLNPSQSSYTFTMGTSTYPFYYNNSLEGVSYKKWPPSGMIYDGMYNFTYSVYSIYNNVYNCSFKIEYNNGTTFGSASGCAGPSSGGQTSIMLNVTNLTKLRGSYYITLTNGTFSVETDSYWILMPTTTNSYWTSIRSALNDTLSFPEWGDDPRTTDFSRIVFFFIVFAIILGAVNFFTQYDSAYPGAMIPVMTFVVIILSGINGVLGPGYFYLEIIKPVATNPYLTGGSFNMIINNWIVALHFLMLTAIYFFTTNKRYQAG